MKLVNKIIKRIKMKLAHLFLKNSLMKNFGVSVAEGEECVILGNGPSLKDSLSGETLEFIKNKKKFCVNESVISDEFLELKPDYVVFVDPYYWAKNTAEPFHSMYQKAAGVFLKSNWKIKIFMPEMAREWNFFIDIPNKNKNIEIVYFNTRESKLKNEKKKFFEYKHNLSSPRMQNVLIACLYLALNIGFEKIYLFGADHSWHESIHIREDNVLCYKDRHFYDKEEVESYTPVYKNPECTKTFSMAELFTAFGFKYITYEELERYSKDLGAKIYNASKISYIDAFERIKV